MTAAIALMTLGGLMIYSALEGVSMVDVLRGVKGKPLDPAGGYTPAPAGSPEANATDTTAATGGDHGGTGGGVNSYGFKGPNVALLVGLANAATGQFNLTITSVCRSASHNAAVGGSSTSMHLQCRAFDSSGKASDMAAFARWVWDNYKDKVAECYYYPAGITGKGGHNYFPAVFDNPTMVHVSA